MQGTRRTTKGTNPSTDSCAFAENTPQRTGSGSSKNSITGIITVDDTDMIQKTENGTEIPADFSDISSGATLKITFDHSGKLTKILIVEEMFRKILGSLLTKQHNMVQ